MLECSIKDVSVDCRMVNNATFSSKILLSISAIFADVVMLMTLIHDSVVLFDRSGISIRHAAHCVCRVLVFASS